MEDRIEGKGKMLENQGEGQTKDLMEEVGGDRRGGKMGMGRRNLLWSHKLP